jgi:threonine synthase
MPQMVYYVTSALALGGLERPVSFSVPTGNFGNIFAGYAVMKMGLPVHKFICASNRNDILARFFDHGVMERRTVEPSLSPSMDIQVSSNFERLMFELLDRDGDHTRALMERFSATGQFTLTRDMVNDDIDLFSGFRCDDEATLAEIARTWKDDGILMDPHSAVGLAAAREAAKTDDHQIVALACAHPAKFPDAVEKATGIRPELPDHLRDLMQRPHQNINASASSHEVAALIDSKKR